MLEDYLIVNKSAISGFYAEMRNSNKLMISAYIAII